ncbi:MAG: long-chain fatty aldehyde decarbonylase [Rhizobacter sp.]
MDTLATETKPSQRVAIPPSAETRAAKNGKDQRYFDLMAYIVSNTISGEIMAVENYSEMVPLMGSTDEKIETVKQANEESKHIKMLASLGKRLDYPVKTEIVEPQWRAIRGHFSAAVKKKDLAACLIIQDLMTETMAIVLYKTLGRDTDPDTAQVAGLILADELEHLGIGARRLKAMLEADPDTVHDALIWAHHRVMPELFSMISTSCHALCAELSVDCGGIGLDSIATDIEMLRVDALDAYMETLEMVGFDHKVTMPLIAGMASYGVQPKADLRLRSDAPAACSTQTGACC